MPLVHRHIQKIQGPLSLGHAHHRNRRGFIVGFNLMSPRKAKIGQHAIAHEFGDEPVINAASIGKQDPRRPPAICYVRSRSTPGRILASRLRK
jgi:hypothetical protein